MTAPYLRERVTIPTGGPGALPGFPAAAGGGGAGSSRSPREGPRWFSCPPPSELVGAQAPVRRDEDRPPNSWRSVCRTEGGASVAGTLLDPRAEAAGGRGPGAPAPRSVPPRRTEGVGDPPGTGRLAFPRPLPQEQPCPRTGCAASAGSPQVSEGLGKARRISLGPAASGPGWLLSGSLAASPPSQVRGSRSEDSDRKFPPARDSRDSPSSL